MEYRSFGHSDLRVSALGLGTEYLIDRPREHVARVIHKALDEGINYYDLFFAQPEFRDNMGAAFRGRRHSALLAAHLGAAHTDGQYTRTRDLAICERFFYDFLRRYHTDYVDVLFVHNSDDQEDYDTVTRPGHLLDLAERLRSEGKARLIGFSGHTASTATQAARSGRFDVVMFPVNLAGNALPGKRELLATCAQNGVALVAMKPFAGGRLLLQQQQVSMERVQSGGARLVVRRPTSLTPIRCLAYVLGQPGVSTVVPGCKDTDELDAALGYLTASDADRDYAAALADMGQYTEGACVYCNHCLPCPSGIDIGLVNRLLDLAALDAGPSDAVRDAYEALEAGAEACVECGACEQRCPFGVPVVQRMRRAAVLFSG